MTEFLITCEHGGDRVPAEYHSLFATAGAAKALRSHRGYDPGALDAAFQFSDALKTQRICCETTRLLVDLNRSLDNPELYSRFTSTLSEKAKTDLLQNHYFPYRDRVQQALSERIATNRRVIHLSIHTFTPRFRGKWRPIDVGLLFDPERFSEESFCEAWRQRINDQHPRTRVVANEPYAGTDDGFTTHLRRKFPETGYLGIEVEINHRYWKRSVDSQRKVVKALLETIPHL
ncbi:N-formylglutamate amidohydrolase [Rubripirellula obstinata]|uniref:N-formylglutamate amidohydrolase n=1 Tax=Rubripirellula obstinata TaxID=406547 RepID=A0A5B1CGY7_9BACT|nr:N-formylglutamate amidohydrolase [Rubripirellula obstinata]KAA1259195.1 N-formylglutamate amidohydrolase [Rubripirellula obstinata]